MLARGLRMVSIDDLHVRHEEAKDFRGSVACLYESGVGSSRQLRRYRQVRSADLAFFGWCVTVVTVLSGRGAWSILKRALLPIGLTSLLGWPTRGTSSTSGASGRRR